MRYSIISNMKSLNLRTYSSLSKTKLLEEIILPIQKQMKLKEQMRLINLIQIRDQRRFMCFRLQSPRPIPHSTTRTKSPQFKKVQNLYTLMENQKRFIPSALSTTKALPITLLQIHRVLQVHQLIRTHRERLSTQSNHTKNDDQSIISFNQIEEF